MVFADRRSTSPPPSIRRLIQCNRESGIPQWKKEGSNGGEESHLGNASDISPAMNRLGVFEVCNVNPVFFSGRRRR